jgi:hypothetical protein
MTPRIVRLSLTVFLTAAVFRSEAQPPGQQTPPPPASAAAARINDPIVAQLTLADDTVDQVLRLLEMYTGRSVLRQQALPAGSYTINRRNLRQSEAIVALETLLAKQGIAVMPFNDQFLNVTVVGTARFEAPELITRVDTRASPQRENCFKDLPVGISAGPGIPRSNSE